MIPVCITLVGLMLGREALPDLAVIETQAETLPGSTLTATGIKRVETATMARQMVTTMTSSTIWSKVSVRAVMW